MLLGVRMIGAFLQNQALTGDQFFQLIGTAAHHVLSIGGITAVFIEIGFAGDDQPVAEETTVTAPLVCPW